MTQQLITRKRVLGQGSFGKVKLAYHYPSKRDYAVKILKKKEQFQNITNLKEEITALQSISSPFVVKLFAVLEDEKKIYIVQEFLDCGELEHLIQQRKVMTEDEAKFFVSELVCALEDLHKHNIVTRDLKPANIMLSKTGHVKIIDMGLCKKVPKGHKTYSYCGTLDYNPPEIFMRMGHDVSADYWSLGVIVYELLTGLLPFYHHSEEQTRENICDVDFNIFMPEGLTDQAKSLIMQLFERNIEKRKAYFEKIKEHPWFEDINWRDVRARLLTPPFIFKKELFPSKKFTESVDNLGKLTEFERKAFQELSKSCGIKSNK